MIEGINDLFSSIDQQTAQFCRTTGLHCKSGCGACCEHPSIETTVAEMLPLALWAVKHQREDEILRMIAQHQNPNVCVFYKPVEGRMHQGQCSIYEHRPGLCRLFGFAAQSDSTGARRLATCKVIKETYPEDVVRAQDLMEQGVSAPIINEHSLNVLSIDPNLGKTLLPIAKAARQAIEYVALKQGYQE